MAKKKRSRKNKGPLWWGLKASGRSLRASVAVIKSKKTSKAAKTKAEKRLVRASKGIRKFQGLLGLSQRKWTGVVKRVVDKHAA